MKRSGATEDTILLVALRACAVVAAAVVALVAVFLALESVPILANEGIGAFFTGGAWHPSSREYDLTPMIVGTALAALGAVVLAAPLGVLAAVFVRWYAPRALASALRRILELLAGIPSVVYGFWGLVVLVPLIVELAPPGPSLLAASIVLALMVLPTVALFADAALGAVPAEYVRGAAALGLSRATTLARVVLPAARGGIASGVLLAAARAVGETMAVLMVAGNVVQIPDSVFAPVRTLTANIALEMGYAMGDHRASLFVTGLVLLVAATLAVAAMELTGRRAQR